MVEISLFSTKVEAVGVYADTCLLRRAFTYETKETTLCLSGKAFY